MSHIREQVQLTVLTKVEVRPMAYGCGVVTNRATKGVSVGGGGGGGGGGVVVPPLIQVGD